MGGLARKATIIENLSNQNINPIVLDAGDLFFKKDKIEPGITTDIAKINACTSKRIDHRKLAALILWLGVIWRRTVISHQKADSIFRHFTAFGTR